MANVKLQTVKLTHSEVLSRPADINCLLFAQLSLSPFKTHKEDPVLLLQWSEKMFVRETADKETVDTADKCQFITFCQDYMNPHISPVSPTIRYDFSVRLCD